MLKTRVTLGNKLLSVLNQRIDGLFLLLACAFFRVVERVLQIDALAAEHTELMGMRFSSLFRLGMTKTV